MIILKTNEEIKKVSIDEFYYELMKIKYIACECISKENINIYLATEKEISKSMQKLVANRYGTSPKLNSIKTDILNTIALIETALKNKEQAILKDVDYVLIYFGLYADVIFFAVLDTVREEDFKEWYKRGCKEGS